LSTYDECNDLDGHHTTYDDLSDGTTATGHYHVRTSTRHEHNDGTSHYHVCSGPHTHEQPHATDDARGELGRRLEDAKRGPIESTR